MPEERRLQVYQTDLVRVTFDPNVCTHSGFCLRSLPVVFDPQRTGAWIKPDKAPANAVMAIVARCPSGALHAQLVTSVLRRVPPAGDPG